MDIFTRVFKELIHISLVSGFMILAIITIRGVFGQRLTAKFRYLLWIVLLIRLVFPVTWESDMSIENVVRTPFTYFAEEREPIIEHTIVESNITYGSLKAAVYREPTTVDRVIEILTYIWIFGIFTVMFLPIISYITLRQALREEEHARNKNSQALLDRVVIMLDVKRKVRIYYSHYLDAPALIGVFQPIIILPYELMHIEEERLRHILMHEVIHCQKKHLLLQWIFWFVKAVYWFNPLIWLAHEWMKLDAELACDEAVVKELHAKDVNKYGHTLIDLSDKANVSPYAINAAGMMNKKSELRRRIVRISTTKKPLKLLSILTVVIIVLMLPVFFTVQSAQVIDKKDIVINKQMDELRTIDNHMMLTLQSIHYDSNKDIVEAKWSYEISQELFEKLPKWVELDLEFSMNYPKSYSQRRREEHIIGKARGINLDNRLGELNIVFKNVNYSQEECGVPRIQLNQGEIRVDSQRTTILLMKDEFPYEMKLDDLVSIKFDTFHPGTDLAALSFQLLSVMELKFWLNTHHTLVEEGSTLSTSPGSTGEISNNRYDYVIKGRKNSNAIIGVDTVVYGYSISIKEDNKYWDIELY